MKRMRLLSLVVLAVALLAQVSPAQKVVRMPMSPGTLGTYTGFPVSAGLRTVAKGMKVYLNVDTTGAPSATFAWTVVEKPTGSSAVFSDPAAWKPTFIADVTGKYIISVALDGGKSANDTLYASTYMGLPTTGLSCAMCHAAKNTEYQNTGHAQWFKLGISGQLEVESYAGKSTGVYNKSCIKCHTTGWEPAVDNGNFGFEAFKTGFDTTWYKNGAYVGGEYLLPYADSTMLRNMFTNYPTVAAVAQVGCESCHGPGKDHAGNGGNKTMISVQYEAGACLQCHDAPNKHAIGKMWKASNHSTMATSSEEAARSACWPCHSGSAMVAYSANPTKPDYSKTEVVESINCVTCHDPHSDANPTQLRMVTAPALLDGYAIPTGVGGAGVLCMNCHRSRYKATDKVAAQQRVFGDRYYAHYSPQTDMFLGTNAIEYGLPIKGIGTHQHLENACVTCHMPPATTLPDHNMAMVQNNVEKVTACKTCHGNAITKFDDVKAFADYDGNGKVEGAQTEVAGLLAQLKAILPKDATGAVVTMKADSAVVKADKNYPQNLSAMWNYSMVTQDFSMGIHNMKYTVAILKASLGTLTGVEVADQNTPKGFALSQNYPNPFNPSTTINFSVARAADVKIHVFNSTGQLIATLADGQLAPGNYNTTWSATNVPSGVYFYRMSVTSNGQSLYNITRKMVVMK